MAKRPDTLVGVAPEELVPEELEKAAPGARPDLQDGRESCEIKAATTQNPCSERGSQAERPSGASTDGGAKDAPIEKEKGDDGGIARDGIPPQTAAAAAVAIDDTLYSLFSGREKRLIILCVGICAFFSPVSGQIYFPALNAIAADLGVSSALINLTVTTYMILQGLAPSFIGGFSDTAGRRPAYIICFAIYLIANIGLTLQTNYAALMVLRCVQSAGSSGTVSLVNAVVADMVTSQDRGRYVSYVTIAPQLGPALGPIIGGLLAQHLGWHSIFCFLLIFGLVVLVPVLLFFPETCRKVVGDGSVPAPPWDRCLASSRIERRLVGRGVAIRHEQRAELAATRGPIRFPSPLGTFRIVVMKESGFVLMYVALVYSDFYATTALIPSQFGAIYDFNESQIALCYLPLGAGTVLSAVVRGRIIDSRYRVHARRLGISLQKNRSVDLADFPIERARIEVAIPTLALAIAWMVGFAWMVERKAGLAGPVILLFFMGFGFSATGNSIAVLLVDMFPGRAGAASAANNLCRCWLGAGATAAVVPLIGKIGIGWTSTCHAGLLVLFSPVLWCIMAKAPGWRRATRERLERERPGGAAGDIERGGLE